MCAVLHTTKRRYLYLNTSTCCVNSPPGDLHTDYWFSQIPPWDDDYSLADLGQADPDYPFESYI